MSSILVKRILALDVRPRSFGYVVFKGPNHLLGWGVRSFRKIAAAGRVAVARKIVPVLEEFVPSVIVLKAPRFRANTKRSKLGSILDTITKEAKGHGIPVRTLNQKSVANSFAAQGASTKYEIASLLADRFPDLAWKLPPKRKPWQSEDYRMSIFDAAALGVVYFNRKASRRFPPQHPAPS